MRIVAAQAAARRLIERPEVGRERLNFVRDFVSKAQLMGRTREVDAALRGLSLATAKDTEADLFKD